MYKTLLPDCEVISAQRLCDSFSRVRINGNIFRCSSNCGVLAKWLNDSTISNEPTASYGQTISNEKTSLND